MQNEERIIILEERVHKMKQTITTFAFLLFLFISSCGTNGSHDAQWHVDQLTVAVERATEAIESKDTAAYVVAMESLAQTWESVASNATSLAEEIYAMDRSEGIRLTKQVIALESVIDDYDNFCRWMAPGLPDNVTPSIEEARKLQNIEDRMRRAGKQNVIYSLLLI